MLETEKVIDRIMEITSNDVLSPEYKREVVRDVITFWMADVLNMRNNIRVTSISEADQNQRLEELHRKCLISVNILR